MEVRRFFLLFCLWFFPFIVGADIGISPIVIDLTGKDADAEIAVRNFDTKHNAYVEITPYRLSHPEDHTAPKKRIRHPEKDGLLVFPAKLVLLPGQTQFVRIVKTAKTVLSDQVYEVDFIPKVSTRLVSKDSDGLKLGVRVIVGYGARIILRPDTSSPALSVKRIQDELVIKNTGNTALHITSCTQQVSGKKTEIPLPAYTLFAKKMVKMKLSESAAVTVDAAFMGKSLGSFSTD